MVDKKKKAGLFSKIRTREDAIKITKDCALGFIFVATLQVVVGYIFAPGLIVDAIIYAVLAVILWGWISRVASVLLLIMSAIVIATTTFTHLGMIEAGGSNIILAVIMFWAAIRAVEATFKLHGRYAEKA